MWLSQSQDKSKLDEFWSASEDLASMLDKCTPETNYCHTVDFPITGWLEHPKADLKVSFLITPDKSTLEAALQGIESVTVVEGDDESSSRAESTEKIIEEFMAKKQKDAPASQTYLIEILNQSHSELKSRASRLKASQDRIESLMREVENYRKAQVEVQEQFGEITDALKTLHESIENKDKQIASFKQENQEKDKLILEMKQEIQTLKASVEELSNEREESQSTIESLRGQVENQKHELRLKEASLANKENATAENSTSVAQPSTPLTAPSKESEELMFTLKLQFKEKEQMIASLERKLQSAKQDKLDTKQQLQQFHERYITFQEENLRLQEKIISFEQQTEQLRDHNKKLMSQIDELASFKQAAESSEELLLAKDEEIADLRKQIRKIAAMHERRGSDTELDAFTFPHLDAQSPTSPATNDKDKVSAVDLLKSRISALQNEIRERTLQTTQLGYDLELLKKRNAELQFQRELAVKKASETENEKLSELSLDADVQNLIRQKTNDVSTKESEINELKLRLLDQTEHKTALQKENARILAEMERMRAEVELYKANNDSQLRQELDSRTAALELRALEIERLKDMLAAAQTTAEASEKHKNEYRNQLKMLQNDMIREIDQKTDLMRNLRKKDDVIESLKQQIVQKEKQFEEVNQKHGNELAEKDRKIEKLKEREEELSKRLDSVFNPKPAEQLTRNTTQYEYEQRPVSTINSPLEAIEWSVMSIMNYFVVHSQTGEGYLKSLGSSYERPEIQVLVSKRLSVAILELFQQGFVFTSSTGSFFKTALHRHPWDCLSEAASKYCKTHTTLYDIVLTVNEMVDIHVASESQPEISEDAEIAESALSKDGTISILDGSAKTVKNVKFRSFVCYALNYKYLFDLLRLVIKDEQLMAKYYVPSAMIRQQSTLKSLSIMLLSVLKLPIEVDVDYELHNL